MSIESELIELGIGAGIDSLVWSIEKGIDWVKNRNIRQIKEILLANNFVSQIQKITKNKEKQLEIEASLGNYLLKIVYDPNILKKIKIVKYELNKILEDIEYISFYNKITSEDLEVLLIIFELKNKMLKEFTLIKESSKKWFLNDNSYNDFLENLLETYKYAFQNEFFHQSLLENYKSNINFLSFEIREISIKNGSTNANKNNINIKLEDEIENKIKFKNGYDKCSISYNKTELKNFENSLHRLQDAGLIEYEGYGTTFGPPLKEFIKLRKEAMIFRNWLIKD